MSAVENTQKLHVWMVSGEAAPLAQTGGLGEVMRALPNALIDRGVRVRRWLPAYRSIAKDGFEKEKHRSHVTMGGEKLEVSFWTRTETSGVVTTLVDHAPFFDREGMYGPPGEEYPDNDLRYALFCKAIIEYFEKSDDKPDAFHGHDWQAGLIPLHLKYLGRTGEVRTIFSIHNLAYQGVFPASSLASLGLPKEVQDEVFRPGGIEFYGKVNFMKAGLVYSDQLLTVSPSYAQEILTDDFGAGLEGILKSRANHLAGILNGADYETWNPESDMLIPTRYSEENLVEGKRQAKNALEESFGWKHSERPLIGMVSRLAHQKGLDLFLEASNEILEMGYRVCILGDGEEKIVRALEELQTKHPDKIGLRIGFDVPLSHLITAGSDMMMLPSRFEPCGLAQMYAMRYGTPPIVHRTGGLADTVIDVDENKKSGSGFVFKEMKASHFKVATARAATTFHNPEKWRDLQKRIMRLRFSWEKSASEYEKFYR